MNGRRVDVWCVCFLWLFIQACGGGEDPAGQLDVGFEEDATDPDVGDDPDVEDDPEDPEDRVCEPLTACPADVCGSMDDGCEGTLDCAPCDCVDGQAVEARCGDCGLGQLICDPGDGFGACEVPEIPGFSGACSELVFVSPAGSSFGDGTILSPYNSIEAAMSQAASTGARAVIVGSEESTVFAGPLSITDPFSLIGGYTIDFQRDPELRPLIQATHNLGSSGWQRLVGLSVQGVTLPLVVDGFRIETGDALRARQTNYAMAILDSNNVTLRNVELRAGAGHAGVDGQTPSKAASGGPGQSSPNTPMGNNDQAPPSGDGGINQHCSIANGGKGGHGTFYVEDMFNFPTSGESGSSSSGGVPGHRQILGSDSPPGNGGTSGPGALGAHGDGGQATLQTNTSGWWAPTSGSGASGHHGTHGSGGGGGGGALNDFNDTSSRAASGGGGGAGGCRGIGGGPGEAGSGSFGLFIRDSHVTVVDSEIISRGGGDGGSGGAGGLGGDGASGGNGTTHYLTTAFVNGLPTTASAPYASIYQGGDGGPGAPGGQGGAGGGGAGGPSVGVFCVDVLGTATADLAGATISVASPAPPGASPGHAGQTGYTAEVVGCD